MGSTQKSTRTKTRRRTRDLEQRFADLHSPQHLEHYKQSRATEDLPGLGQHYCIECAKWFDTERSLTTHKKAKTHKRQAKALASEPYSQKDAEAAVGLATDNGPGSNARETARSMEVEMTQLEVAVEGMAT